MKVRLIFTKIIAIELAKKRIFYLIKLTEYRNLRINPQKKNTLYNITALLIVGVFNVDLCRITAFMNYIKIQKLQGQFLQKSLNMTVNTGDQGVYQGFLSFIKNFNENW